MASKIKLSNANGKIVTIENNDSNMSDVTLNGASITKKVDTLADMRAMNELPETVWCSGYHSKNDGAFGSHFYRLKGLKTTENDNGGTIIVASVGGSDYVYELQYDGAVNVKWFGAVGDGSDNSIVLNAIYNLADDFVVEIPKETFSIGSTVTIKKDTICHGWLQSLGMTASTTAVVIGSSALRIDYLTVLGVAADKTNSVIGIDILNADARNCFLNGVRAINFDIGLSVRTYLVNITNCFITSNNTNLSFSINTDSGLSEANAIQVIGGYFWGATDYCAYVGDDRQEVSTAHGWNIGFQGCDFDNAPMRIGNVGSVKIDNCYFEAPTSTVTEDSEKCIVVDGTLGSVRSITIDSCYFNNTKYAVYCRVKPRNLSMSNCTTNNISISALYTLDSIYKCFFMNNVQTGSFANGVDFHTGVRSGSSGSILSSYYTEDEMVNKLSAPSSAIAGSRYTDTTGRIYQRVNTATFRTYETPTIGILGTKTASLITLATSTDAYNFNAGDALDINGTINYIRYVDYENGIIATDEYIISGAVTIAQIATEWGGLTTALPSKIEIINAYNTSAGDLLTLGGRSAAVDNGKVYSHKFTSTGTAGVGHKLQLKALAKNTSDIELVEWWNTYYRPLTDNIMTLGGASNRWATVYAGTGTINTSDDREKTYSDILEKETLVAKELKALIKRFKFNDAIKVKGEDKARIHYGTSAQGVIAVFEKHGLNAMDYAMICYDEWDAEYETKVIKEAVLDEEGNTIEEAETEQILVREAGNRYGIRYEELLCFIVGAI